MSIARKITSGASGGSGGSGDPYFDNVSFLMDNNGEQGANNNEIEKAPGSGWQLYPVGGQIVQGTATPYGDQGSSGWWPGDAWLSPSSTYWAPGTTSFTIEYWIKTTHKIAYQNIIGSYDYDAGVGWGFCISSIGYPTFFINSNTIKTGTKDICDDQWHHVAISRMSSSWRMFVDGKVVISFTNGTSLTSPAGVRVGSLSTALPRMLKGFFTDIRYQHTQAVYWDEFDPPTEPLTADSATQLLTDFSRAAIYDAKRKSNVDTVGTAQVSTSQKKYGTGSIDVTGSGYLTTSTADSFDVGGVFTVEFWVNYYGVAGNQTLIDSDPGSQFYIAYTAGRIYVANKGNNVLSPLHTPVINQWYHYAVVCDGSTYKIYVDGQLLEDSSAVSSRVIDSWAVGARYNGVFQGNCYIDDLRITKGVARYAGNFTPPTEALPKN